MKRKKLLGKHVCGSLLNFIVVFQLFSLLSPVVLTSSAPMISVINPSTQDSNFIFYTNTTSVGYRFNATINISGYGIPPVFAWQARLVFNSSLLKVNAERAWLAIDDQSYIFSGRPSVGMSPNIRAETVLFGDSLLGMEQGETPPPEPAKLATVEFEIIYVPEVGEVSAVLSIDDVDTYTLDDNLSDIPVTKASGYYEYTNVGSLKENSTITIAVHPSSVTVGSSVLVNGTVTPARPDADVEMLCSRFGETSWATLASIKTDTDSVYFYSWVAITTGTFQLLAIYLGDATTKASQSNIATLIVQEPPLPPAETKIGVINPETEDNDFNLTRTACLGHRFNATVWGFDIIDLYAYQACLTVDDTLLGVVRAWFPPDPSWVFYGKPTIRPTPVFYDADADGSNEAVKIGDCLLGTTNPTYNGSGLLAIIEFEIIQLPARYETLDCYLNITNNDTFLLDSSMNEISVGKTNGQYELIWQQPDLEIQTDKPMYLQKELVRLSITYRFGDRFIENASVMIEVDYPNGTIWSVWATTTNSNGSATLGLILDSSPLGTYWVYATAFRSDIGNATAASTFMVVHYEPKLTLWFEGPAMTLVNQEVTIRLYIVNAGNLTASNVTATLTLPSDEDLQILTENATFIGSLDLEEQVMLFARMKAIKPNRYILNAEATFIREDGTPAPQAIAQKTVIFAYHPEYPVDLLGIVVSVDPETVTVELTVINYGDSTVEVTLIASAQHTATELMLKSECQTVKINPEETTEIFLAISVPSTAPTGEYEVLGILATDLPQKGGFALTYLNEGIIV